MPSPSPSLVPSLVEWKTRHPLALYPAFSPQPSLPGCWVDMWRSGTFLLYSSKAAFWNQEMSPRLSDVEYSVIPWFVFVIGSTLTYMPFFWDYAIPPHVQPTSRYDLVTVTSVLISSVCRCLEGWTRYAYQGHGTGTGTTQGEVVVVKCIYLSSGLH